MRPIQSRAIPFQGTGRRRAVGRAVLTPPVADHTAARYTHAMKAISESIIVLAGCLVFAAGTLVHGSATVVTWWVAGVVIGTGLLGWLGIASRYDK